MAEEKYQQIKTIKMLQNRFRGIWRPFDFCSKICMFEFVHPWRYLSTTWISQYCLNLQLYYRRRLSFLMWLTVYGFSTITVSVVSWLDKIFPGSNINSELVFVPYLLRNVSPRFNDMAFVRHSIPKSDIHQINYSYRKGSFLFDNSQNIIKRYCCSSIVVNYASV